MRAIGITTFNYKLIIDLTNGTESFPIHVIIPTDHKHLGTYLKTLVNNKTH